jgi:hypothetical protein
MVQSLTSERKRMMRIPAALLTVAAMIILPMLVHLLPNTGGVPIGARLLPIFYAPLLAVLLFDGWVAVAASLTAPLLNMWLTGMPAPEMALMLTTELVCFSLVAAWLSRGRTHYWWIGPVAYLLGKGIAWLILAVLPLGLPAPSAAAFLDGLVLALPGLLALVLVGFGAQQMAHARRV